MPKTSAILLLSVLTLFACGEPPDTRPGQPVAHRRAAFTEILKAFEPMGVMLRTDAYDPKRFQALSRQLLDRRDGPWAYFGADTLYPPSNAKAEVWLDGATFAADKQAFFDTTTKLAGIAGTPDKTQAAAAYHAVEDTCRNCHKAFKKR
jgi:cytochrome c556